MSSKRTIAVDHNGTIYAGEIMRIRSTTFGTEYHGILTANLSCEGEGSGISVGGYTLDGPPIEGDKSHRRVPTAYGLDHLVRIMDTVGVSSWEELPGQQIIVLSADGGGWGSTSCGIAGLLNDKVLIFKEHAESFREVSE